MQLDQSRRHHREVSHHGGVFEEAVESFHHLDDGDVRAGVDELMIGVSGVGPAPGISEGVELRLAYFAAGLPEEDIVIGVGVKRRIEINEIDAGIGEFFRVAQPRRNYPRNIVGSLIKRFPFRCGQSKPGFVSGSGETEVRIGLACARGQK